MLQFRMSRASLVLVLLLASLALALSATNKTFSGAIGAVGAPGPATTIFLKNTTRQTTRPSYSYTAPAEFFSSANFDVSNMKAFFYPRGLDWEVCSQHQIPIIDLRKVADAEPAYGTAPYVIIPVGMYKR